MKATAAKLLVKVVDSKRQFKKIQRQNIYYIEKCMYVECQRAHYVYIVFNALIKKFKFYFLILTP